MNSTIDISNVITDEYIEAVLVVGKEVSAEESRLTLRKNASGSVQIIYEEIDNYNESILLKCLSIPANKVDELFKRLLFVKETKVSIDE